jgi:hypothetical protein
MLPVSLFQLQLNIQDAANGTLPYGTVRGNFLGVFISTILPLILIVVVFLALFNFLQAALDWISAGGDKGKIEKAREKITGTVIGLIVLFSIFAMFMIIQRIFGFTVLNFGGGNGNSSINTTQSINGGGSSGAACISCPGGSCPDGWSYGPDSCAPQATCALRAIEACAAHGGSNNKQNAIPVNQMRRGL